MDIRNQTRQKTRKLLGRQRRVKAKIFGSAKRPRLSVFRSNQHIYAQLVNDENNTTLAVADDLDMTTKTGAKDKTEKELSRKRAQAFEVGKKIAQIAKDMKIEEVIFDRGASRYHGRVKSLAEGARAGGLKF